MPDYFEAQTIAASGLNRLIQHTRLIYIPFYCKKDKCRYITHSGIFGFSDEQSILRLSPHEFRLLATHSPYRSKYNIDKRSERPMLIDIVNSQSLLRNFPDYISGKKPFNAPVYSVWGNHEDVQVLMVNTSRSW